MDGLWLTRAQQTVRFRPGQYSRYATDGPNINLEVVIYLADQQLGRPVPPGGHVIGERLSLGSSSNLLAVLLGLLGRLLRAAGKARLRARSCEGPREAEVAELHDARLIDENVFGLDITMEALEWRAQN